MEQEYIRVDDWGICDFCGQAIEPFEEITPMRHVEEDETRLTHRECFADYEVSLEDEDND